MNRLVVWLIAAVVTVSILSSAGPALIGLAQAAVPLVIALGGVVVVLRLVWHFTDRY
jgi:hypothetical protein